MDIEGSTAPEHQSKLELLDFAEVKAEPSADAPYPAMPRVREHREALDALRSVGAGSITVDEAYAFIEGATRAYLWPTASASHGSLVGALMCRALFPHLAEGVPLEHVQRQWEQLRDVAFDGLAFAAAVGTFAVGCAAAGDDPVIEEGRRRLWDQKLHALLPPPEFGDGDRGI